MLDLPIEDLISVLFIMIAVVLTFVISLKSFKSYRANKVTLTVIIAVSSFFVALAMIFLTLEKAFFTATLPIFNTDLGMLCGAIAIVVSGAAVLAFCIFAYEMAFPKKTKILGILSAFPIIIYLGFWLLDPTRTISSIPPYEIIFGQLFGLSFEFTPTLSYFTLVPLFSVPIIILFYFAMKVRKESGLKSKRAAGLGIGGLALASAYIAEIIGLDPTSPLIIIIIVLSRALFIVAGAFFYWALFRLKSKE